VQIYGSKGNSSNSEKIHMTNHKITWQRPTDQEENNDAVIAHSQRRGIYRSILVNSHSYGISIIKLNIDNDKPKRP